MLYFLHSILAEIKTALDHVILIITVDLKDEY